MLSVVLEKFLLLNLTYNNIAEYLEDRKKSITSQQP